MEIQRKKILYDSLIDRTATNIDWGKAPSGHTFYINILLTQSMDNMGLFTDIAFISGTTGTTSYTPPDYTLIKDKLTGLNINPNTFNSLSGGTQLPIVITPSVGSTDEKILRLPSQHLSDFYNYVTGLRISGYTDSKINDLISYNASNPYIVGFDMASGDYYDFTNTLIHGVNRIYSMAEPRIYVFDTPTGVTLGQPSQVSGLQYIEYTGITRNVVLNDLSFNINQTQFNYIGQGSNMTNTSLSALTKEEYLFGIISPPEVKSEVFIDRGITPITDKHLRLSEIKSLNQLTRYGNGMFKINKQQ